MVVIEGKGGEEWWWLREKVVKNGDCDGSEYAADGGDVSKDVVEVMVKNGVGRRCSCY